MRRVILESPFAGDVDGNIAYARRCLRDSLNRGEAPLASHLLYPGTLDDNIPEQRQLGIEAGLAWILYCDAMVLYVDRGISQGMRDAMVHAQQLGVPVELRGIDNVIE